MSAEDAIREEVRRAVGPATIVLAGSRATGAAREDSDYDVVVVLPALRIPRAVPVLGRAQLALEQRLGAKVSLNPLPPIVLDHPERNLFVWKMLRESRVLAAPDGWHARPLGPPPSGAEVRFSYLLSAVLYLLEPLEPGMLAGSALPEAVSAGVRKAARHVAHVRTGMTRTPEEAAGGASPAAWLTCRAAVLAELGPRPPRLPVLRAAARNAQYATLSALRGNPRWRAAASLRAVDRPLAVAAVRLLHAVTETGGVDPAATAAARRALPAALRAGAPETWRGLRDLVRSEWASAHPVLGL